MKTILSSLALAALLAAGAPGAALGTETPVAPPVSNAAKPFLVTGFRSAVFGMNEAEVRAAIEKDFHPAVDDLSVFDNPAETTQVLALHLEHLDPAPGVVNITYILDGASHRLIHVNVVWSIDEYASDASREELSAAGAQLAAAFRGQTWAPQSTGAGAAPDGSYFVLFVGMDPKKAAVEVRVSGVPIVMKDGTQTKPTGPAILRVAYYGDDATAAH